MTLRDEYCIKLARKKNEKEEEWRYATLFYRKQEKAVVAADEIRVEVNRVAIKLLWRIYLCIKEICYLLTIYIHTVHTYSLNNPFIYFKKICIH